MKLLQRLLLLLLTVALLPGCITGKKGNGEVSVNERLAGQFDRIDAGGTFEIFVRQGPQHEITVVTDENLQENIELVIEDGELEITTDGFISEFTELKVFITVPELKGIDLHGACRLEGKNTLKGEQIDIELSGACTADVTIEFPYVNIDCSGASTLFLSGRARRLEADLSGSSTLKGFSLTTDACIMDLSGASDAQITVVNELLADASGASNLTYIGTPENLQINTSGAADVEPAKN